MCCCTDSFDSQHTGTSAILSFTYDHNCFISKDLLSQRYPDAVAVWASSRLQVSVKASAVQYVPDSQRPSKVSCVLQLHTTDLMSVPDSL